MNNTFFDGKQSAHHGLLPDPGGQKGKDPQYCTGCIWIHNTGCIWSNHVCLFEGNLGNEALIVTRDDEVFALGSNGAGCLGQGP